MELRKEEEEELFLERTRKNREKHRNKRTSSRWKVHRNRSNRGSGKKGKFHSAPINFQPSSASFNSPNSTQINFFWKRNHFGNQKKIFTRRSKEFGEFPKGDSNFN
jgi:hypothetical protein